MALAAVDLDDKYAVETGRVYLSGIQALVRLPMMQRRRDLAAGLNTAGFISGYRGSPLGGYDQALQRAGRFLKEHHIRFQPGVNEDLAATAVWGTQQVGLFPGARYDGVFAIWYGKGPGVDRSGDPFRHANAAGTARHGGVLAIAGDDHAAKSSTIPQQSEHALIATMIPVLNPAGVQEVIDFGLLGWAMSRFSGCWVAMKAISETMDGSATVDVSPNRGAFQVPQDFPIPPGGLHIRWPDPPLDQEERLIHHKLYAALAFAGLNRLDRSVLTSSRPRFGIVTSGKAYLDVREALDDLGLSGDRAEAFGIAIYKVGLVWPLEKDGIRRFAEGLDEILVVEEKRAIIENQLKEQLYNWHADVRPRIVGKFDEHRRPLLPAAGELSATQVAIAIGHRLLAMDQDEALAARVEAMAEAERRRAVKPIVLRKPHFCPGCPHNTSTRVPEGSIALAGIGCHYMAHWMPDRPTATFSQMGGEGAAWIGQAPFTETQHVYVNIGDGTYFHSGVLAIRAAVAAGVTMTYKLLYNDAVAMTGGQPVDGSLTVPQLTRQLAAEGVGHIVVVSETPERYGRGAGLAPGTVVEDREDFNRVQHDLARAKGVSVLIYDQTCAAEKRRRRKRGTMEDPARRVFVNELVCEGCGDCSAKSNCLAVVPVETEFGRKRQIDQSACNKDFSCLKGFCPSFVTVEGGQLKKPSAGDGPPEDLPDPMQPNLDRPVNVYVAGIGGTGVVTIGALLGMAAHLEGKAATVLDQTGLAQKGGAVTSHIRIAQTPDAIYAARIGAGRADLVLGCDLIVTSSGDALSKLSTAASHVIVNGQETVTGSFIQDRDFAVPSDRLLDQIRRASKTIDVLDAGHFAMALVGDAIGANLFLLGYAWQKGQIPLSRAAIEQAITLNGVAVALNRAAFQWGRFAAHDPQTVREAADRRDPATTLPHRARSQSLDELIDRRAAFLAGYQNQAYADRYRSLVAKASKAELPLGKGTGFSEAVARGYFKLLAYKDEYEVARLFTDGSFNAQIAGRFEGAYKLRFHLAPPLLARLDPVTGEPRKRTYGPWMMAAFRLLARLKWLRGTPLDPFGRSEERRTERRLISDYETTIADLMAQLTPDRLPTAIEIARLPLDIRGFGHVKARALAAAKERETALLAEFGLAAPAPAVLAAE